MWILKQATLALPAFGSDTRLSIEELVAGGLNQRDQVIETNTPFNFDDAISDESRRFAKTGSGHTKCMRITKRFGGVFSGETYGGYLCTGGDRDARCEMHLLAIFRRTIF